MLGDTWRVQRRGKIERRGRGSLVLQMCMRFAQWLSMVSTVSPTGNGFPFLRTQLGVEIDTIADTARLPR